MNVKTYESTQMSEQDYSDKMGSLLQKMKTDILRPRMKSGSIYNSGWKRIPAIKNMHIELQRINEILACIGITRRLEPKITFKTLESNKANRYIEYTLRRLIKLRDQGRHKEYWIIANMCLQSSHAFRVSAFNRVFPKWWYDMKMEVVTGILIGVDNILKKHKSNLKYRRVYIPKDLNSKPITYRPLGVPEGSWRVVSHMLNNFITLWIRKDIEKFNDGFLPGRGTGTALKKIIETGYNESVKYIYEFDLKQFFNNVNVERVSEILLSRGMPSYLVNWIEKINRRNPLLKNEDLIDESYIRNKSALEEVVRNKKPTFQTITNLLNAVNKNLPERQMMAQLSKEGGTPELWGVLAAYLTLMTNNEWITSHPKWAIEEVNYNMVKLVQDTFFKGLPQGLNTSPILSLVTLIPWIKELEQEGIKAVMYADDGYLYSDQPFEPFGPEGIELNLNKSKWVKKDGKFLETSKFLGMVIDFENNTWKSETREGNTLEMREDIFKLIKETTEYKSDKSNLEYLISSGLLGYVQSRMYCGDWNEIKGVITEWKAKENSWVARTLKKTLEREGIKLKFKVADNKLFNIDFKGSPTKSSEACEWLLSVIGRIKGKVRKSRSL